MASGKKQENGNTKREKVEEGQKINKKKKQNSENKNCLGIKTDQKAKKWEHETEEKKDSSHIGGRIFVWKWLSEECGGTD